MKKNRVIYIFLLIILLFSSVLFESIAFVFMVAAVVMTTVISMVPGMTALRYMDAKIQISSFGQKNTEVKGRIIINQLHKLWIPEIVCDVIVTNLLTGDIVRNVYRIPVGIKDKCEIPFSFCSKYCGCLEITIEKIGICDMWGMVLFRKRCMKSGSINVMPKTFKQEIVIGSQSNPDSSDSDFFSERLRSFSGEMYDVKEYRKGDSIKNIHWKLTGKHDQLMVKRLSAEVDNSILLLFETGYAGTEQKAEGKIMDALAEVFISLSQNLIASGVKHKIGWQDQRSGNFILYEMKTEDDMIGALPKVLSAKYSKDGKNVISHYYDLFGPMKDSHVVCVAPESSEFADEDFTEETVATFLLGAEKKDQTEIHNNVTQIRFAVDGYEEALSYMTI